MCPEMLMILTLGVLTTVSGQRVNILECASLQLKDGKKELSVATVDISENVRRTCLANPLSKVTWTFHKGNITDRICNLAITGCNTLESADGCACVSRTEDLLTVSLRWTFNKTKHTGAILDLVPNCVPDGAYNSRTKCDNLQEYNACAGVKCGPGKCVAVNDVAICNCSGFFRTGKHCEVLPCSKQDCGESKCAVPARASRFDHKGVCPNQIARPALPKENKKPSSMGKVLISWIVGAVVYLGVVAAAYWNIRRMYPTVSPQVQDALARQNKKLQDMKEEENKRFEPSTSHNYLEDTSESSKASPESDVDSSVYDDKDDDKDPKLQAKYH